MGDELKLTPSVSLGGGGLDPAVDMFTYSGGSPSQERPLLSQPMTLCIKHVVGGQTVVYPMLILSSEAVIQGKVYPGDATIMVILTEESGGWASLEKLAVGKKITEVAQFTDPNANKSWVPGIGKQMAAAGLDGSAVGDSRYYLPAAGTIYTEP